MPWKVLFKETHREAKYVPGNTDTRNEWLCGVRQAEAEDQYRTGWLASLDHWTRNVTVDYGRREENRGIPAWR
ncbi:hypothetical protein E2C01_035852 [Portunus trituberculatus]|uniref:Uncharacterized protein n=1 Tax=Portunus trituberculatus TaxID=210409 RepID=A0A5B7FAA6_PORTR|nr:hypothetical protein [Portunus trituberculatus]